MKKTTFVSLLVAGLLISPAVLAQHVQADQVSSTTTEETVTPSTASPEVTETVYKVFLAQCIYRSNDGNYGISCIHKDAYTIFYKFL